MRHSYSAVYRVQLKMSLCLKRHNAVVTVYFILKCYLVSQLRLLHNSTDHLMQLFFYRYSKWHQSKVKVHFFS